jgi:hypothetical protein
LLCKQERQVKSKESTPTSASNITSTAGTGTIPPTTSEARTTEEVDPEISLDLLNRLVDMGFSRDMSIQALRISPTVEQATEYLLNTPAIQVSKCLILFLAVASYYF